MKFTISSVSFLKQLNNLRGVVPSNPVIPILENFLLEIEDGQLTVTASDLKTTIMARLEVDSDTNGGIAVPAKMLLDTLKNLPEQPVTFVVDEENHMMQLLSANGQYKLAGEAADDYPKPPAVENAQSVELLSHNLLNALAVTGFAVSTDELKPAMNGIFLQLKKENTTFVSTDSHRLVRYSLEDVTSSEETEFILPSKAADQLKAILSQDNLPVQVQYNDSNALFAVQNITLVSRLIDETFPKYENVIPTDNELVLTIERPAMISSLKRMMIYANKVTNQVRLKLTDSQLQISAEDIDFANEGSETLHCDYNGEEIEIGFDAKLLIEMLNNLDSERVVISMSEPNRAVLIREEEAQPGEDLLMLIMPVMLASY